MGQWKCVCACMCVCACGKLSMTRCDKAQVLSSTPQSLSLWGQKRCCEGKCARESCYAAEILIWLKCWFHIKALNWHTHSSGFQKFAKWNIFQEKKEAYWILHNLYCLVIWQENNIKNIWRITTTTNSRGCRERWTFVYYRICGLVN